MICFTGCVAACVSPERATDYRQVVECSARNPCKHGKRISNPDGVTEFCRAFGTFILVDTPSRGFVLRTSPPACVPSRPSAFVDPSLFGQTRGSAPTLGANLLNARSALNRCAAALNAALLL